MTRSQASAVLGSVGKPVEAPQGPTCIYKTTRGGIEATIALQQLRFSDIRADVKSITTHTTAGRQTFCGVYGKQTLFAPLTAGWTLVVAAPCPDAQRLAADALERVGAGS